MSRPPEVARPDGTAVAGVDGLRGHAAPVRGRRRGARQVRFLAAGAAAVVTDVGVFALAFGWWHRGTAFSTIAAFAASLVVSFGLNKLWVFESRAGSVGLGGRQLVRYVLLLGCNVAFTYGAVELADRLMGTDPRLTKIGCVVVTTLWNYPLYRWVVFREGRSRASVE